MEGRDGGGAAKNLEVEEGGSSQRHLEGSANRDGDEDEDDDKDLVVVHGDAVVHRDDAEHSCYYQQRG